MLQVQNIRKKYVTGDLTQIALDDVSLSFRDNEFVAILGPSGSGKTTLLNIIGGLDRYDSGDLIINNISTKKYTDRDWDSYRNHTIGFVFQSYNLIPHQTVLANVELALTISGVSASERKKRAIDALTKVGLGDQLHKKPNQMSGGQMQRVAIARALVNDPDILLADEPTGALDTKTSVQIMDLLKEVADDRLVIMVTHNPELAEQYATRIVQLKDGHILGDTNPFNPTSEVPAVHKNMGKASMSFLTSLALSFNNLKTKKGRTILTAFAGSIGIIGIALILSLSNGVNNYIENIQEDTLSEYPLTIYKTGMDYSSMMGMSTDSSDTDESPEPAEVTEQQTISAIMSKTTTNDLASLRSFIESGDSGIYDHATAVEYTYNVTPRIYRLNEDESYRQVNPDTTFTEDSASLTDFTSMVIAMSSTMSSFSSLPENSSLYENQYDVMAGRWPENDLECVVVLTSRGTISDLALYAMGLKDTDELDEIVAKYKKNEEVTIDEKPSTYNYDDFLGVEFKLVNVADTYEYDEEYGIYVDKSDDKDFMTNVVKNGETMKVVGVVKPNEDASASMLTTGIAYPSTLSLHVMEKSAESDVVKAQLADPDVNIFTGEEFGSEESGFDMDSLFSVDEDALADAFGMDSSSFDMSSLSLGDMNLDGLNFDLSGLNFDLSDISFDMSSLNFDAGNIDLADILKNINVKVSTDELLNLFKNVVNGYVEEAAKDPSTDYSKLGEALGEYLKSENAQTILKNHMQEILDKAVAALPDTDDLSDFVTGLLEGFSQYLTDQGVTDYSDIGNYLIAYIGSDAVQTQISGYISNIQNDIQNIAIDESDISAMASDLYSGYESYAAANDLPETSKLVSSFADYIGSEAGQKLLMDGISKVVDMDELSAQLGKAMSSVMSGYSDAMQNVMSQIASQLGEKIGEQLSSMMSTVGTQLGTAIAGQMTGAVTQMADSMQNMFSFDADSFSNMISVGMDSDSLQQMMVSMVSAGSDSYDDNLETLNYGVEAEPYSISIYPINFEHKTSIIDILDGYNDDMEKTGQDDKVIVFSDTVATLMSSVTDIIDTISYVLIAFVAISLVVSSIMIGIITYISVLERTKEIGILRAIGASKHNISQVFNAETFIIGLLAGIMGIVTTLLILIPANFIIHDVLDVKNVTAALPPAAGVILIIISVILTLIGGFIPAKSAAKKDPVLALRSE